MSAMPTAGSVDPLDQRSEPVFTEPWQAQAFALAVELNRLGRFSWAEWVETFGAEIARHPAAPGEDPTHAYYRQWLAALEALIVAKGLSSGDELARRKEEWRVAYLRTPHGSPVELARAWSDECDGDEPHDDDHARTTAGPIASSPARTTRAGDGP
jgi:nitrile hydratase accessory protein